MSVQNHRQRLAFPKGGDAPRQLFAEDAVEVAAIRVEDPALREAPVPQVHHMRADRGQRLPIERGPASCATNGKPFLIGWARAELSRQLRLRILPMPLWFLDEPGAPVAQCIVGHCRETARGSGLTAPPQSYGAAHLRIVDGRPRARLRGAELAVEFQRLDGKLEAILHERDHPQRRVALRILEWIPSFIEVTDHFEHERAGRGFAVVTSGGCRRKIPPATCPDDAVRRDSDVLGNVRPAVLLCVHPPHAHDRGIALIFSMVRAPCMMHMNFCD